MNIKQHIEAGHYPTDAKGRAMVPVESEFDPAKGATWIATICAIDGPGGNIVGFGQGCVREWGDDGTPFHPEGRLLPPAKDCPHDVASEMLIALRVVNRVLEKNRLAGTDQNPKGVRDLVFSAMTKGQRWIDAK